MFFSSLFLVFLLLNPDTKDINCDFYLVSFQDVFPDKATERKIMSLAIMCPNDGCDWTGELRDKEVKTGTVILNVDLNTTVKYTYTIFVSGSLGILPF